MSGAAAEDTRPARVAAILAGGAGSRMGGAKATARLAGAPMIAYPIAAARAAGLEPIVVAKAESELPELNCEIVTEPDEPLHPAAGIVAALERVGAPIVVAPCDAPLLPPELLAALAASPAAFATPDHPRAQPLIARYTPALATRLRRAMTTGESMVALTAGFPGDRLGEEAVAAFGDPVWIFANVNEPPDLARLTTEIGRLGTRLP